MNATDPKKPLEPLRARSAMRFLGFGEAGLLFFLVALVVFFSFKSEYFFTARNLTNILGQIALPLVAGIGLALLMIGGEIDLSIGSLQAVVALPLILVMNATGSFALGAAAALAAGAAIGTINGLLVTRLRINSLIATLGMFYALRGFVYLVTGKTSIADGAHNELFFQIGNGRLGPLPWPAVIVLVLLPVCMLLMRHTAYGRKLYATGGNPDVARAMGIHTERIKLSAFILCSVLAAVSAILLASRLGSANHLAGLGFEFQVVAAVVLGGVSLAGGVGSLLGVFLGVLILGVIGNGLRLLGVDTTWQLVITGAAIIVAVAIDAWKRARE